MPALPRLRLGVVVAVTAGVVALGPSTGAASPRTGSAVEGRWNATLHYEIVRDSIFPRVSRLRLRVTRGGVAVYNRTVPLPTVCKGECSLLDGPGRRSFELRDLRVGRGPAAVIWFWTGGAHCCTVVRVISIPDGRSAVKNFGDPGARIVAVAAVPVFRSADDRFAYLFTSFASSGFPLQLWRFRGDRFVDVTRDFRDAIASDAMSWWKAVLQARRSRGEARGVFAAWAADMCALGERTTVERELAAAVRGGVFSPPRGEVGGPIGSSYAAALRSHLRAWGYCR